VDVKVSITYDKNRSHENSRGVFVNMRLNDSYAAAAQKTNHVEEDSVYERVPATVFRGGCSSDIRLAEEVPAVRCTNIGSRKANVEFVAKKTSKRSGKKSTGHGEAEMFVDEDSSDEIPRAKVQTGLMKKLSVKDDAKTKKQFGHRE
jgi:hypothetical protein